MEIAVEQGTKQWFDARLAKFTSSEWYKLFKSGTRLMTELELADREKGDKRRTVDVLLGDGARTYIREKVAEIMTNGASAEYKAFESQATDWGKTYEPEARDLFESLTGLETKTCGFYQYNDIFGGSPDGIIEEVDVLEIKCPINGANHIANRCCKNAADLLELNPEYYIQIQGNLLATGLKHGWFVSYDPRFFGDFRIKILQIPRDHAMIEEGKLRLEAAAELMNEYLTKSMDL